MVGFIHGCNAFLSTVLVKILNVYFHRLFKGCPEFYIEANVPGNNILFAIAVYIGNLQAAPPAFVLIQLLIFGEFAFTRS
jgi:hypothetical protein